MIKFWIAIVYLLNITMAQGQVAGIHADLSYLNGQATLRQNKENKFLFKGGQATGGILIPGSYKNVAGSFGIFGQAIQAENTYKEPRDPSANVNVGKDAGNLDKGKETMTFLGAGLSFGVYSLIPFRIALSGLTGSIKQTGDTPLKQTFPTALCISVGLGYMPQVKSGPYLRFDYQNLIFGEGGKEDGNPDKRLGVASLESGLITLGIILGG